MVLAHLRKGETYRDLAIGFGVGTTTAYRYLREALAVLAALAPTLAQAMAVAARKAYVVLDSTLLRIGRVAMASKNDGPARPASGPRPRPPLVALAAPPPSRRLPMPPGLERLRRPNEHHELQQPWSEVLQLGQMPCRSGRRSEL